MEYKRLTTSENTHRPYALECFKCFNKECNRCDIDYAVWERLAELEDKIEQGTIIELPTMLQDKQGDWRVYFYSERYGLIDCYVYDTREEAEKRLKELQNG